MRRRSGYPALRIISIVLKVAAGALVALWLIMLVLLAVLSSQAGDAAGGVFAFGLLFQIPFAAAVVISAIMLWAFSELILLAIDVENNTRRASFRGPESEPEPYDADEPEAERHRKCPGCGHMLSVPAGTPKGARGRCPKCDRRLIL